MYVLCNDRVARSYGRQLHILHSVMVEESVRVQLDRYSGLPGLGRQLFLAGLARGSPEIRRFREGDRECPLWEGQ